VPEELNDFANWLEEELERRGWNQATLAERADVNAASISNIIRGRRAPAPETLLGIARALDLPATTLYRRAGLLPSIPSAKGEKEEQLLDYFRNLPPESQELLLTLARTLHTQAGPHYAAREEPPR
jgi:transcriptional regulator with XRE-family HTH domain